MFCNTLFETTETLKEMVKAKISFKDLTNFFIVLE